MTTMEERGEERRISIKKSPFGNFVHQQTQFVFDKATKIVVGKELEDGTVAELTEEDITRCKELHFQYKERTEKKCEKLAKLMERLDNIKTKLTDMEYKEFAEEISSQYKKQEVGIYKFRIVCSHFNPVDEQDDVIAREVICKGISSDINVEHYLTMQDSALRLPTDLSRCYEKFITCGALHMCCIHELCCIHGDVLILKVEKIDV